MPNQSTPEIDRLRDRAHPGVQQVHLSDAIQAVRDTEARCEETANRYAAIAEWAGRKRMAREIVEALRERAETEGVGRVTVGQWQNVTARGHILAEADYVERTFLNGSNEERAHNVPFHDYNCPICAERNTDALS